ncbi:U11/U12 small nuclear ribonucleoprotein 48 kDa protein [Biomphalaria glabrata]|nr:U11/U12 small nuclear ribonucleoprotein 48 kDa protein-like [Biomphalaria glabrata]
MEEKISSELLNERRQYVESALSFLEAERKKVNDVLEKLGLSSEELLKTEKKQVCPYDNNHIMPEKALKKHIEKCKLLTAGHQKDELPSLLQDLDSFYSNANSILKIVIDENLLNKIIWDHSIATGQVYTGHRKMPISHIDENIVLTQKDRLALYQYVVRGSHEAGKVIPVDRNDDLLTTDWGSLVKKGLLDEQNNKQYSSKLEQLAALRDLKRRRQSYRAKNVHITKKSYTEIIREVIYNQMEILAPEDRHKDVNSTGGKEEDEQSEYNASKVAYPDKERRRESPKRGSNDSWRARDVERNRSRERSIEKRRSRNYYVRGRDRSRERKRSKERDRSWDRSKGRNRSRERRRSKEKSRHRDRSRERFTGDKRHVITNEDEKNNDRDPPQSSSLHGDTNNIDATPNALTEVGLNLLQEIKTEALDIDTPILPSSEILANVLDKEPKASSSDSDTSYRHKSKHKKHKHKKHSKSKKHKIKD